MYVLHGCCARRASELIKAVGRWFDAGQAANYGRQHLNQFLPDLIYMKRHRWQELLRNLYKRRFDLLTFSTVARIFASIFIGSFQLWLPFCVFFFITQRPLSISFTTSMHVAREPMLSSLTVKRLK